MRERERERFICSFLSLDKNELRAKATQEALGSNMDWTWNQSFFKKVKVVKIKS